MILKRFTALFLIFCFNLLNCSLAFDDSKSLNPNGDLFLQKDEEINYIVKKLNPNNVNYTEKTYHFIIKKYTLFNNTNNNFKVVQENELYNQDDYNLLLSLKKNSFRMSEDTFFYSVMSVFFPPLLIAAVPFLIVDTVKTPFKAVKNRKEKKQQRQYKQTLIGAIIPPNSQRTIFTLQNPERPLIQYELSVQNTSSGETFVLKEPQKALKYSEKQDYADKSIEQDYIPEQKYFNDINTKEIIIYTLSSQFPKSKFSSYRHYGNIIHLNKDTVFIAGGKQKYSDKNSYNHSNLADLYNLTYGYRYAEPPKLLSERINPCLFLLPDKNVLIYGGTDEKTTEIFDIKKMTISQGPKLQTDLDKTNSFSFLDKENNLIIGKINNNFVEKYNTQSNTTEKIDNVKTGAFVSGEDENYIYFADYNQLSRLNKNNLQYEIYANNIRFPKTNIIGALRLNNGIVLIAEKNENNLISVYEFNQTNSQKYYWAKNIGTVMQFIHSADYEKGFILAGKYNAILYSLDDKNRCANSITSTQFSLQDGQLSPAYSDDKSITAIDSNSLYLFRIIIKQKM